MNKPVEAEFDIYEDGDYYASVGGPRAAAIREALHYVAQTQTNAELTRGTGSPRTPEVEVYEVTRTKVSIESLINERDDG